MHELSTGRDDPGLWQLTDRRTGEASRTPHPAPHEEGLAIPDGEIRERTYDVLERHCRPEGFEMQFRLTAKRGLLSERRAVKQAGAGRANGGRVPVRRQRCGRELGGCLMG